MKQSDIESLRKQGYTEEEISVALDALSKLTLSNDSSLGTNRDDRSVNVTSNDGVTKKTSSIMMGYNKDHIELPNGEYVSFDEFTSALNKELSSDDKDVIYVCKKTGKKVSSAEMIENILREATSISSLNLTESNVISNQTAKGISILEKNKSHNKGILMLGNPSFRLPNGEYVLGTEVLKAMDDYVKMTKGEVAEPIIAEPGKDVDAPSPSRVENKDEKYRVINRIKKKLIIIPIILCIVTTLLTGFKVEQKYDEISITTNDTVAIISVDSLIEKTETEIIREVETKVKDIKTGEKVKVEEGLDYHYSSDYKYNSNDRTGVFGKNNPVGEYNVDYISIIHNGKIVHTKFNENESVEENLKIASSKVGVDVSELEAYIHLGGPVSGWVEAKSVMTEVTEKVTTKTNVILERKDNINGEVNNFNGSTIKINDNGEEVELNVSLEDGTLVKSGTILVGSNGKSYRVQELSVENVETTTKEMVPSGKKLTWSIHNISKEHALATAATAAIITLLSKKNEKEKVTMTASQIEALVFDARSKFESESEFHKAVETITHKSIDETKTASQALMDDLISQNITVEDINNMGGISR